MRISIVIPAYNEQDNIQDVIDKIEQTIDMAHELVVVNDHSTDSTREIVEELTKKYNNIILIENRLEKGFARALKTGFDNVSCEVVVPIMADLCDDLSTIKKMIEKIDDGYDVVCGSRYMKGGARLGGSKLKGFFSCFVGGSLYYLFRLPTHDIANAFKMYRKKVIDNIDIESKEFEASMEIPLKAHYLGFKITEVPTRWKERTKGKSNFKMLRLFPYYFKLYIWAIFRHGCTRIKTRMHTDKKSVYIR